MWPVAAGQGRASTGTRPSCEASSASSLGCLCPAPETSRCPALAAPLTPRPGILASPGGDTMPQLAAGLPACPPEHACYATPPLGDSSLRGLPRPGPHRPGCPRERGAWERDRQAAPACSTQRGFRNRLFPWKPEKCPAEAGRCLTAHSELGSSWPPGLPLPETCQHQSHPPPSCQPDAPPGGLPRGSTSPPRFYAGILPPDPQTDLPPGLNPGLAGAGGHTPAPLVQTLG